MNDYLRASDLVHIPAETAAMYEPGPGARVTL
jgi:hypothetical protein